MGVKTVHLIHTYRHVTIDRSPVSITAHLKFTKFTFTFIHLADVFIQSDLQLLYMSEVARLWSN